MKRLLIPAVALVIAIGAPMGAADAASAGQQFAQNHKRSDIRADTEREKTRRPNNGKRGIVTTTRNPADVAREQAQQRRNNANSKGRKAQRSNANAQKSNARQNKAQRSNANKRRSNANAQKSNARQNRAQRSNANKRRSNANAQKSNARQNRAQRSNANNRRNDSRTNRNSRTNRSARTNRNAQRYNWNSYRPGHRPSDWSRRHSNFDRRAWHRNYTATHRYHWNKRWQRPRNWRYHRYSYGQFLPSLFWGRDYWINDYWNYGLANPPYGYVWVRYGPDAALIDIYDGSILRITYRLFY